MGMMQTFVYPAKIVYIYEAGKFEAIIDLGFKVHTKSTLHLRGYAPPETGRLPRAAKQCVMQMFLDKRAILRSYKQGRDWYVDAFFPGNSQVFADAIIEIDGRPYLDMAQCLSVLERYDFDHTVSDWVYEEF